MNAHDSRWIPLWLAVPEPGQDIFGMAADSLANIKWWRETWDPQEPVGKMTHWMPVVI